MKIGITLVATNGYFCLGLRFVRRFLHFYKGTSQITFYFFSDKDPKSYLPEYVNIHFIKTKHDNWVDGTNSKFLNIISIEDILKNEDFVAQFDADTNISSDFDEEWFYGKGLVAGQHYADQGRMKEEKAFDRNPKSKAYVPKKTKLPQMYYYGAFFAGDSDKFVNFCKLMREWQLEDKKINYEPGVNDESYINCYFHFNPPNKVVLSGNFKFDISHKGGLPDLRKSSLNLEYINDQIKKNKERLWNIQNGKFIVE